MKDYRIELRWGLLISLVAIIWNFIEKTFLNWHDEHISSQFGNHFLMISLLYFICFYIALNEKKKVYYKGKITWRRAFASGAIIAILIALLSPLVVFFNYHYISPEYFDNMISYQTQKEKFPMSSEGAREIFNMKSFMFIEGFSLNLCLGFLISTILAFPVRNEKS